MNTGKFDELSVEATMEYSGGFSIKYALGAAGCAALTAAAVAAAPVTMGGSVAMAGLALAGLTGTGVCTAGAFAF